MTISVLAFSSEEFQIREYSNLLYRDNNTPRDKFNNEALYKATGLPVGAHALQEDGNFKSLEMNANEDPVEFLKTVDWNNLVVVVIK